MKLEKSINLEEINGNEILEFLNKEISDDNEDLCDISPCGPLEFESQNITSSGYTLSFTAYYNNWGTYQPIEGMKIHITEKEVSVMLGEPFEGDGSEEAIEESLVKWLANHKFITFDAITVKFRGILEFCGYQLTQLSMTDTDRLDNIIKELQEARALMKNKK